MTETPTTLAAADIVNILDLLPHRYPFLLVDRIIEIDGDNSCIGIKNVTFNEPQFTGHFPGRPVFPGVLLIEGMAQTAGAICVISKQGQQQAPAGFLHDHRQGEVPQARRAGRPGRVPHAQAEQPA